NGQQTELYINDGMGGFTRMTPFGSGSTFAVCWADFDNDGAPDLAIGRIGPSFLYNNTGNNSFPRGPQLGTGSSTRTIALAWADFDRDGDLDLAAGNGILGVAQQNSLLINNGDGTFTRTDQFGAGQTCSLAWADFDNDGDPDLAVGTGGFGYVGQNYL